MYSEFLVYNRKGLGIRILHSFLQIVLKITRNSYYWHMTQPAADCVAKTCIGNFSLCPHSLVAILPENLYFVISGWQAQACHSDDRLGSN